MPYPPENAQELYDALPNAQREMKIIPGAPHFLSWTHAKEVNDATVKFLDRVTGVDSEALAMMPLSTRKLLDLNMVGLTLTPKSFSGCASEQERFLAKKRSFWQKLGVN